MPSSAQPARSATPRQRPCAQRACRSAQLHEIGCEIILADLQDAGALATAIGAAEAVQVILPLPLQAADPAREMRRAIESLAGALETARPKRVLAISDYGAHITHDIGMPTMFRLFEERLGHFSGEKVVLRSAEHMQNWGRAIPPAVESGTLLSFHDPVDMLFPTISAADLGVIAASLLLRPAGQKHVEVVHAEGPRRYSANDVATALSELLGRTIRVEALPRSQWKDVFERGLSPSLADLLIKANDAQNKGGLVDVEPGSDEVRYGTTELIDALRPLLRS